MPDSQGWIAIEDDIPESGEEVLGYWSEKVGPKAYMVHFEIVVYMWASDQWSLVNDPLSTDDLPVTHWQNLPNPPDRVKPK